MKINPAFFLMTITFLPGIVLAQQVGIGTTTPHASALMDVSSTSKGMLVPRMTTAQRNAIASPAQGLLVYDTDVKGFMFYNGTAWTSLNGGGVGGVFTVTDGQVHNTGDINSNNFIFGRTGLPQSNQPVEDKFLFFLKDKGALRAGAIASEDFNWAPENIGTSSVALGYNNLASGNGSVALGGSNIASATFSTALGNYTKATGAYSTATGNTTKASGAYSFAGGTLSESTESAAFAYGTQNKALDRESFAAGEFNIASAPASMAINSYNHAKGWYSFAAGKSNRASGLSSAVFGEQNVANTYASFAIGRYNDTLNGNVNNWIETDPLFMIGNGSSNASRHNALTVLKNGNVGLGTSSPASLFHLKRNSSEGYGQMILEETGDNADGARITYKNSGSAFSWDLYGNTGLDLPTQARFNFHFTNPGGISRDILTLTGIGSVGIGNVNPSATLDIQSDASAVVPQVRARVNTADFVRMRMSNAANTTSYWDIASLTSSTTTTNANMNFYYSHLGLGGWNILTLKGNGNATLYGTLTQNSDERLKKNIERIENPLDLLQKLSGYHYQWKDEWRDPATQSGLLAQEVEKVMPDLVKEDDKGIKSVNYSGMIPYLLEAIKTLHATTDSIQAENERLKKEMETLKNTDK